MSELARALDIVGHKWTLLIVQDLLGGPRRFTEIQRSLAGANPKMVTARLRELEAARLISRTSYAEVPPRVEYALTERGRALRPAVDALRRWGAGAPPRRPR
ncbi:MAG TPA: helix-turn-helix domain-containing protein [Candidatus Limnocylindria bacterium]|nr:helix-turn-helix domain-containing protein [Candidatus Limnocylindria bacterium]